MVGCIAGMLSRPHGPPQKKNWFQARAKQTSIKRQFVKSEQESDAFPFFLSVVADPMWSQQPKGLGSWPRKRAGDSTWNFLSLKAISRRGANFHRAENSYLPINQKKIST